MSRRSRLTSGARALIHAYPLAMLILVALAVRLALTPLYANLPNDVLDEGFWEYWMQTIHNDGVLNIFRTTDTDYVGYHWVLWALTGVYDVIGGPYDVRTPSLHVLIKMLPIAFDVALILVVYHSTAALVREQRDDAAASASRLPLIAAGVIAFHPAALYDSAVWAQTDSAITAAMLGSIVLAYGARPAASGCVYALGLAVKPHPVIIGPVLALTLLRHGRWKAIALAAAAGAALIVLVLAPWIAHGELRRIIDVYHRLFTPEYGRLSELAWNGNYIFDRTAHPVETDAVIPALPFLTYRLMGMVLSLASVAVMVAYALARPGLKHALIAASYQAFAFWALPVGTHERYLYPFIALMLPVAVCDRRWLWLYVPVSATFFLNLVTVAPPIHALMGRWVYAPFTLYLAGFNMAMFAAFTAVLAGTTVATMRRSPRGWLRFDAGSMATEVPRTPEFVAETGARRS